MPVITVMKYFYELLKGEPKLGHNGETGGQGAGVTVGFTMTNCSPKVLPCEVPVPNDQWAPLLAVAVDTSIIVVLELWLAGSLSLARLAS